MRTVYADNNATTQIAPEVFEAMRPTLTDEYFNPSSMYDSARTVADMMSDARERIARHLGADDPGRLLFTSCATESNNTAIRGTAEATSERRHIVTTAVEHPAVLEVCKYLERFGYEVTFLPVDGDGQLSIGNYVRALRSDTLLVTIIHANNETGVIFPVAELARIAKETDAGIAFHTDATQSVGKIPIDLQREYRHVDLLSFSGHKFHAPKGIGALYIRRGARCRPLMIGGHQESGRRAGTENVPGIVAMAKGLDLCMENHDEQEAHIRRLRDRLEKTLQERIPCVQVNGLGAPRMPGTLNISCHFVEGEGMLFELSNHGICASSGSACTSGSLDPSHVLKAMNVPFSAVHGSIRFSFSRYNTEEDVDKIIEVLPEIVANLRTVSLYWDNEKNAPSADADAILETPPGTDW